MLEDALRALPRPVRLIAAGGTIAMGGTHAVPVLDADQLVATVPALGSVPALSAENVLNVPSAHMTVEQAHELATRVAAAAAAGAGIVVTTGTDTLEEIAVLCALMHGGSAPIVVTGANRPAFAPGADGAANLIDAVAVAGAAAAEGLGCVVVFGGEVHAAMTVRKVDSTGPAAFGSPSSGPIGRVVEGRLWIGARPVRPQPLRVASLSYRVEIITSALGSDGALLAHVAQHADGIVLVALGAGHLSPPLLAPLRAAVERVPVVLTCRPDRSSMLFSTYGFEGSEADLRSSGAVCAPFLAAPAARMALLCCLGAGLDRDGIESELAPWDAGP
jgi:L-asparaginase